VLRLACVPILAAGLLLAGCGRNIQTEAAVRQGVVDYLSGRPDLNLSQMQVDVTAVSFRQDEADATVSFRPRGAAAASGMQMRYTLERKGGRWVVKGKGAGPHASASPSDAPSSPAPGQGGQLPPGHPQAGSDRSPGTKK
jgi:hypothetical protein